MDCSLQFMHVLIVPLYPHGSPSRGIMGAGAIGISLRTLVNNRIVLVSNDPTAAQEGEGGIL